MPPSAKCIVIDAMTVVSLLVDSPSNENISLFQSLFDNGPVFTTSTMRKITREYDGSVWDRHDLSRIDIVKRDIHLSKMVANIRMECTKNGLDVSDRAFSPKLDILACARMNGATIVSVDDNLSSPISIGSLAGRFGIRFRSLRQ